MSQNKSLNIKNRTVHFGNELEVFIKLFELVIQC